MVELEYQLEMEIKYLKTLRTQVELQLDIIREFAGEQVLKKLQGLMLNIEKVEGGAHIKKE
jgi:hypothetical protein